MLLTVRSARDRAHGTTGVAWRKARLRHDDKCLRARDPAARASLSYGVSTSKRALVTRPPRQLLHTPAGKAPVKIAGGPICQGPLRGCSVKCRAGTGVQLIAGIKKL